MSRWVGTMEICCPSFFGDLSCSRKYFWMLWEPSEWRERGRLAQWGWDEVEGNFGDIWRSSGRLAVGVACMGALPRCLHQMEMVLVVGGGQACGRRKRWWWDPQVLLTPVYILAPHWSGEVSIA